MEIAGESVGVHIREPRRVDQRQIVGVLENTNASADILRNAKTILAERIYSKWQKMKNIQRSGPKWLTLLNQYWLADIETYRQALTSVKIEHDFEKILFVTDTGDVYVLFDHYNN
jgi:hypothetical protein